MRNFREIVAGTVSISGNTTCAVITQRTPARIAAWNGTRSVSRSCCSDAPTTGSTRCESVSARPCPGKCLAHAATRWDWMPSVNAAVCAATRPGSAPNERTPMIGFAGLLSMSTSGARSRLTPPSASIAPMLAATRRVSPASSIAPSAALPG